MVRQKVNTKSISFDKEERASGNKIKQNLIIHDGINKENAQDIVKKIKNQKLKGQSTIQGEQIRVSGIKRDDLQNIMSLVENLKIGQPIQFINLRD